jgi:hypothetical protein
MRLEPDLDPLLRGGVQECLCPGCTFLEIHVDCPDTPDLFGPVRDSVGLDENLSRSDDKELLFD